MRGRVRTLDMWVWHCPFVNRPSITSPFSSFLAQVLLAFLGRRSTCLANCPSSLFRSLLQVAEMLFHYLRTECKWLHCEPIVLIRISHNQQYHSYQCLLHYAYLSTEEERRAVICFIWFESVSGAEVYGRLSIQYADNSFIQKDWLLFSEWRGEGCGASVAWFYAKILLLWRH